MEAKRNAMLAVAIAAIIMLGWFFRYDVHVGAAGGQGVASSGYMVNRWTGTAFFLNPYAVRELRQDAAVPASPPTPDLSGYGVIDLDKK